jgi:hypothetical protein
MMKESTFDVDIRKKKKHYAREKKNLLNYSIHNGYSSLIWWQRINKITNIAATVSIITKINSFKREEKDSFLNKH